MTRKNYCNVKYILAFQDDVIKYMLAVSVGQLDAETVTRAFVANIVLKSGTPRILQTHKGANFISEVFRNTCKILKIKKIQSTVFHPESQGCIERSYRMLAEYLRHYVNEDQTSWDEWIPFATHEYHSTVHSYIGFTTLVLLFGRPHLTLRFKEAA